MKIDMGSVLFIAFFCYVTGFFVGVAQFGYSALTDPELVDNYMVNEVMHHVERKYEQENGSN